MIAICQMNLEDIFKTFVLIGVHGPCVNNLFQCIPREMTNKIIWRKSKVYLKIEVNNGRDAVIFSTGTHEEILHFPFLYIFILFLNVLFSRQISPSPIFFLHIQ